MITLSQRDVRWKDKLIGKSNATIGRYGCTITSLSMITHVCGDYHPPDWMAKNLLFTSDGRLYWNSVNSKTCLTFRYRYYSRQDDKIKSALKNPSMAVILQVDGFHWVWCVGTTLTGHYKIHDPWMGDPTTTKRYKNITGFAVFDITRKKYPKGKTIFPFLNGYKNSIPFPEWLRKQYISTSGED